MSLQMTENEVLYQRKNFYETLDVHGIPCKIYTLGASQDAKHDFYGDVEDMTDSFLSYIDTRITYETLPTIKTLRSLGWYVDNETLPVVAHIPVYYRDMEGNEASFRPQVDDKVVLVSNPIDVNSDEQSFLIKDFIGRGFPNVIYYVCKLVHAREDT